MNQEEFIRNLQIKFWFLAEKSRFLAVKSWVVLQYFRKGIFTQKKTKKIDFIYLEAEDFYNGNIAVYFGRFIGL